MAEPRRRPLSEKTRSLAERQNQVFDLALRHYLSPKETAARLGVGITTVRTYLKLLRASAGDETRTRLNGRRPGANTVRAAFRQNQVMGLARQGLTLREMATRLRVDTTTIRNDLKLLRASVADPQAIADGRRVREQPRIPDGLPPMQRQAYDLRAGEWLSTPQMAERLGITPNAVRHHLAGIARTLPEGDHRRIWFTDYERIRRAYEMNAAFCLRAKGRLGDREIAEALGVERSTIAHYLSELREHASPEVRKLLTLTPGERGQIVSENSRRRLKDVPILTPEQETFRRETAMPIIKRIVHYTALRMGVPEEVRENALLDAERLSHAAVVRYDPRKSGPSTFFYPLARGAVFHALRDKVSNDLGLKRPKGDKLERIIAGVNRGKTVEQVAEEKGIDPGEARELHKMYQDYLHPEAYQDGRARRKAGKRRWK